MPPLPTREIRDPLHGAIRIDEQEKAIIDHPFVQRLRGIRQLGFSHVPFPGATHSRFAHSLGVMELAGRVFDAVFRDGPFSSGRKRRLYRHCVRLAALCHDLGHGPFSHAAEFAMPPVSALGLDAYAPGPDRRATHEDYTVAILTRSPLAAQISATFALTPLHVAALISPEVADEEGFFLDQGYDLRGIFSQIISSNLDADRLDYLVRDSYFTGASYGRVDVPWLVSHLGRHIDDDGRVSLSLDRRALYAFDNFMVARFHMFLMVYFHQKSVAYELLLQRCLAEEGCTYRLPADMEGYLHADDAHMLSWMRASPGPWAARIVNMRPYQVALELHGTPGEHDLTPRQQALTEAGIDAMIDHAVGAVYQPPKVGKPPIYLVESSAPHRPPVPLSSAVGSVRSDMQKLCISRIYVPRADLPAAHALLAKMGVRSQQQSFF